MVHRFHAWLAREWTDGCSQVAVAVALMAAFLLLIAESYYRPAATNALFIGLAVSLGGGLALTRAGWATRPGPSRLERAVCMGAIAASTGAFLLVLAGTQMADLDEIHDGRLYYIMAKTFLERGEFWVDGWPSHHFPPLYPLVLAGAYAALGPTLDATKVVSATLHLASLAAVYWTTRQMFGADRALRATAVIGCVPVFILFDARNSAEHAVLLLFTLTLYCVWMSLKPESRHYIVYAGLFAGLGYLTKSSLGSFFIVAGLAGLAWRWKFMGAGVLKDRYYQAGIATFAVPVVAWSLRNINHFWDGTPGRLLTDWQSSAYFNRAIEYAFVQEPFTYVGGVLLFAAMACVFVGGTMWPCAGLLRRSWRRRDGEEVSFFWLGFGTTMLLSLLITPIFWVYEVHLMPEWFSYGPESTARYFGLVFVRYSFIGLLPLLWAAFEQHEAGTGRAAAGAAVPR